MLQAINKRYIIFGTFIYLLIAALFPIEYQALYALNYFSLFTFVLLLDYLLKKPEVYFTKSKIGVVVFYYSAFFVLCNNLVSYFYTGNYYVFSEADALVYHREAGIMSEMSFFSGIDYYLRQHEVEDLGMVLVLSLLYKFVVSKIALSVFYVLIAVITAYNLYGIAKRFMPLKYAGLCTITYCLSSYVIWYHSSGLKESMMILVIIMFYNSYYNLLFDKKSTAIWGVILMPLLLFLFRPVLVLFCIGSIVMGIVLKRKLKIYQLIFLFIVVLVGIYFIEPIIGSTDKFLLGGTESMLEIKQMEGMIKGSVSFTYLVNTLSSMFGPFPSLVSTKNHLSFYAPGLIFKIFISLAFWFGVIHIIKIRFHQTYPMLLFVAFETISLTYILEALELRKSIPHFPLMYVVAFILIYKFDSQKLTTLKEHLFYKKYFNMISIALCVLMVYWNFR